MLFSKAFLLLPQKHFIFVLRYIITGFCCFVNPAKAAAEGADKTETDVDTTEWTKEFKMEFK